MKRAIRFAGRYVFALLAVFYALTLGLFIRRHRALVGVICRHFGMAQRGEQMTVPLAGAELLGPEDTPIVLLEAQVADGNVTLHELALIARSVAARSPACLLELGTFDGRTTLNLAANATNARVFTVDLPGDAPSRLEAAPGDEVYVDKSASGARFADTPYAARIEQRLGDTANLDFSDLEGACDWVFVDAAHSYDYVMNDSRVARQVLRAPGIILWHDYGSWDGVTRALNELQRSDPWFAAMRHIEGTSLAVLIVSA